MSQLDEAIKEIEGAGVVVNVDENMKRCSRCGALKHKDEYYKANNTKSGLRPECKECHRKNMKIYYEKNKEKMRDYGRRYYAENRARIKERQKDYYENVLKPRAKANEDNE